MRNVKKGRVSLERAISKLGLASRAEAKTLILEGKVKVHGSVEKNPLRPVNPDTAHIEINGAKAKKDSTLLILFHKPKNCLTTKRDPEGRKTIYDYLPESLHHLHAVGRLDQQTTGLLLLTNNTQLSSFLTDPRNQIPRIYVVEVRGEVLLEDVSKMIKGIQDGKDLLAADQVEILKASGRESRLKITLSEGKNREVRRLCLAIDHEVTALKRIQFGEYELGDIPAGEFIEAATLPLSHSLSSRRL